MKIISKLICGILGIILGIILINLIIGILKYGGVKNYSDILNEKDWQSSISNISLGQPKTRFSIFYADNAEQTIETQNLETPVEVSMEGEQVEIEKAETKEYSKNPYDPDYEDEFNSFFGTKSNKEGEIIPVEEIENLGEVGFKTDDSDEK